MLGVNLMPAAVVMFLVLAVSRIASTPAGELRSAAVVT
jgi:hypothetical protein